MTVIFFLKMLCDSALYYAFTAPLALFLGGGNLMSCMVLQSAVYALARSVKHRALSLLCLLPLAVCYYLCMDRFADLCIITPITGYILWQALRSAPLPKLERQRELLEKMSKPLLGFGLALALVNGANQALPLFPNTDTAALEIAAGTVFSFGLLFWGSCVALLRALRHDPEIFSQKRFHILNLSTLLGIAAVAVLLGSRWAVGLYKTVLHGVYTYVLVPLFVFLSILPIALFSAVGQFLKRLLPESPLEEPENEINTGEFIKETMDEYIPAQMGDIWRIIGMILLIAVVAAVLFFLIRKALRTPRQHADTGTYQTTVTSFRDTAPQTPDFGLSPVYTVRRQYRKFLKLCRAKGLTWKPGSTSREISSAAEKLSGVGKPSFDIRALYMRARYRSTASFDDARQMRSLVAKITKSAKSSR